MIIFTKFHKDWRKIVNFLLIAKFWARELFFGTPSTKDHFKCWAVYLATFIMTKSQCLPYTDCTVLELHSTLHCLQRRVVMNFISGLILKKALVQPRHATQIKASFRLILDLAWVYDYWDPSLVYYICTYIYQAYLLPFQRVNRSQSSRQSLITSTKFLLLL